MKRQLLDLSVHRELVCWTNTFQDIGTLFSVKSSQNSEKALGLLISELAIKSSCGYLWLGSPQLTVLAPHCMYSQHWMQLKSGHSDSAEDKRHCDLPGTRAPPQMSEIVLIWYTRGICTCIGPCPGLRTEFTQPRKMITHIKWKSCGGWWCWFVTHL